VTVPIIGSAFFTVHQHIIGFGGFFKLIFGIGIVGITIRVVLHRHPAIGLFDLLVVSTLTDTKYFVKISF